MSGPQLSCIIIDDDEIDRLTTLSYAKKYPFLNVAGVFSSATEALSSVNQMPADVMLSDIDMPDLNGVEFRSKMMKTRFVFSYPRIPTMPLIVLKWKLLALWSNH